MEKNTKSAKKREVLQDTVTFQLPLQLKKSFKAKAAAEDKRIKDVLCELIESYVKNK